MKSAKMVSRPGGWALPLLIMMFSPLIPVADILLFERFSVWSLGAAVIGISMAVAAFVARERKIHFRLKKSGIDIGGGREFIPYKDFTGLTRQPKLSSRKHHSSFVIDVYHKEGRFRIPSKLNFSSNKLYRFLLSKLPPGDPGQLPGEMKSYHEAILGKFGGRKVYVHRELGPPGHRPRQGRSMLFGFFVGLDLFTLGLAIYENRLPYWIVFAVPMAVSALYLLIRNSWRILKLLRILRTPPPSVLILNPLGLAMNRGELTGKLRWRDIVAIKYPAHGLFAPIERRSGILVEVPDGQFLIPNDYDSPAELIYRQLLSFWDPKELEYLLELEGEEDDEEDEDDDEEDEEIESAMVVA
jgi:hypothetical protein